MLSRYLLRQVLAPAILALGLLCALVFGLQALRLGHHLVGSGGGIALFGLVFLHSLPTLLVFGLPWALAAGVLLTASRLATELEGMRSLGASPARLASGLIGLAVVTAGLTFALSAYAEAQSLRSLHELLRAEASRALIAQIKPGIFARLGDVTIYVEHREPPQADEALRGSGFFLARGQSVLVAQHATLRVLPGPRLALTLRQGELQRRSGMSHDDTRRSHDATRRETHRDDNAVLDRIHFAKLDEELDLAKTLERHFAFITRRAKHAHAAALGNAASLLAVGLLTIALAMIFGGRRRALIVATMLVVAHEAIAALLDPGSAPRLAVEVGWILGAITALGVASRAALPGKRSGNKLQRKHPNPQ
ncbi:MAG: LptF/LptG family permease [Deltaproteobacteria bacterium]|nr:LptF/LptG family permease [Deltaproteobacteria bacterium]